MKMSTEEIIMAAINGRKAIEEYATGLDDISAADNAWMFPSWKPARIYHKGDRLCYDGKLYKVLSDHTSQDDWTPAAAVSLFAQVLIPTDDGVIYEWTQPESTNPYQQGDVVMHNGVKWESTVDNNVWEPGVYGWIELV